MLIFLKMIINQVFLVQLHNMSNHSKGQNTINKRALTTRGAHKNENDIVDH